MRTKKILKEQNETVPITIPDKDGNPLAVYPKEMVDTIKATVAKGATNEELVMFLSIANQYGLNPFMKEIWFTKMGDESAIMTSRDGFKKLAERKPNFKKCQSVAVYENDEFEMEYDMGELTHITHKFKQNDRGAIKGAYAVLRTTDDDVLATYVPFREYDKKNNVWRKYSGAMIRKVAENDVYKRFADVNGLNDFESMPHKYYKDVQQEELDNSEEFEPIDIQGVIDETDEENDEPKSFTDVLGYDDEEKEAVEKAKETMATSLSENKEE